MKEKMEKLIQKLKQTVNWASKFQDFNQKNNLKSNPPSRLETENIESLTKHLLKLSQEKDQKHLISWVSSEYQALEIVLNCVGVVSEKNIEDFSSYEWVQIYQIFSYKLPLTIKYESLRIVLQKKQPRRRWCASEQNFLIEIVKSLTKKNKWNDVARQLFIKSDGEYFRQGKHCRERWLNHLHPAIQNNQWTKIEDIRLLSFVLKKGKKWARIAKKFDMKRSQCMVKKRFYELIKIEQQDSLPIETLKNHIKSALQHLRAQSSQVNKDNKQNDKMLQVVDKNYRKCSISKETFKSQAYDKVLQQEPKIELELRPQDIHRNQNSQGVEFSSYSLINPAPNYFGSSMSNPELFQNPFGYYVEYLNMMRGIVNPLYGHFPSVIVPIQNNIIINQRNQNNSEFQKF